MEQTRSLITPTILEDFNDKLPPEGLSDFLAIIPLFFSPITFINRKKKLSYQANEKMSCSSETQQFLNCHVNNIGDSFMNGNFTINSKQMEKATFNYFAKLWKAKTPCDPIG